MRNAERDKANYQLQNKKVEGIPTLRKKVDKQRAESKLK